ncbi:hypothetical protein V8F06_007910 [Rhypophila decipiens]
MFESWYSAREEDEVPTKFWLQFQVINDSSEDSGSSPSYYQEISPDTGLNHQFIIPTHPAVFGPETTLKRQILPQQDRNDDHGEEQAADEEAPAKFHLFTQLPAELRLKIWSCLIRPRIILAACLSSRPSTHQPLYCKISQRPKRRYIPVLLHVCSESRAFALEHYELTFPWKTPHRLRASSPSYSFARNVNVYSSSSSGRNYLHTSDSEYHPAKVYFNFALDTLFLLGELEPSDGHGFNAPMVYFLRREDTSRVKHVACAFEELHLGVYDTDLIFGSLFHIVDRFPSAKGVLPPGTIAEQRPIFGHSQNQDNPNHNSEDEQQHPRMIKKEETSRQQHQFLIVTTTPADASILPQSRQHQSSPLLNGLPTTNNVIQKLWRAWAMGSGYWPGSGGGVEPVPASSDEGTSSAPINSLVNAQMVMVREEELASFVGQIE